MDRYLHLRCARLNGCHYRLLLREAILLVRDVTRHASGRTRATNVIGTCWQYEPAGDDQNTLATLTTRVGQQKAFTLDAILTAHHDLMRDDVAEAADAGRIRDMQNWIGGSDHSPRDALYVPPPADLVDDLLADLPDYLNRDDVPAVVQASIAHAQCESIHAFTDGNGRIGRALVGAVFRRRDVMRKIVVPVASGLLARRDDYFAALGAYRGGDPSAIVRLFATAATVAADESHGTLERISALPAEWRRRYAPRAGSAGYRLMALFLDRPVLRSDEIEDELGHAASSIAAALDAMMSADVVREITGRKRNRAWAAMDLMAELDDLDRRIARAITR